MVGALRETLDPGLSSLASPARLQNALEEVLRVSGGHGRVAVRRSPGALLTPESWHVLLSEWDQVSRAAIERLVGRARP